MIEDILELNERQNLQVVLAHIERYMAMQPEDIMRMNYLVENVIGDIPETDEVVEDAKSIMELKDVEESK